MQLKLGFRMNVWQQVTRYQLTDLHMWRPAAGPIPGGL